MFELVGEGSQLTVTQRCGGFGSVKSLIEFKRVALRRHVWFTSLSRVERGIIDLTVKYVDSIKSSKLARVVTAIVEKLQTSMESKTERLVRTVGLALAKKASDIAVSWGNRLALAWAHERAFARFLVFNFGMVAGG
jgi:hypothetical protein